MTQETDTHAKPDTAEATRHEILHHAQDLFTYYGFNKTNIGDIAERCGMSPGNLYRYYKNKQAMGRAVVQTHFRAVEAEMGGVLLPPEGTAEQRIRAFLRSGIAHLVETLAEKPKIVELADFICSDEEGLAVLQVHIDWKRTHLVDEITRGVQNGALKDCDAEATASAMLLSLKAFWMPMTLALWRDPDTIMPELDMILDLMFRGLRAP